MPAKADIQANAEEFGAARLDSRWFRQVSRQQVQPALSNAQAARSGRLQDGKDGRGPAKEERSAAGGGDVLVAAGTGAEEVAELVVAATEPGGRPGALEAAHGPASAFQAPVVLFQPVIQGKRCSATLEDLLEALKRRDAGGPMRDIVKSLNVSRGAIRACRT